jgi:hypothetical protein
MRYAGEAAAHRFLSRRVEGAREPSVALIPCDVREGTSAATAPRSERNGRQVGDSAASSHLPRSLRSGRAHSTGRFLYGEHRLITGIYRGISPGCITLLALGGLVQDKGARTAKCQEQMCANGCDQATVHPRAAGLAQAEAAKASDEELSNPALEVRSSGPCANRGRVVRRP